MRATLRPNMSGSLERLLPRLGGLALALCCSVSSLMAQPGRGEGFLFHPPVGSASLRFGYSAANARSDLFSFFERRLTLEGKDFGGFTIAGDLGFRISERLEILFGVGYSRAAPESEFRDYIGEDELPIVQTTQFDRIPFTVGLKFDLLRSGRSVGSLAWIPSRFVPYVAGGVGGMRYRVVQEGEFVDESTLDIFEDKFESAGWAPAAHAGVGFHFSVTPEIMITGDWRYTWAGKQPAGDFREFDRVDLSSRSLTLGIGTRF
jgi:opacity protein-like surface antigen